MSVVILVFSFLYRCLGFGWLCGMRVDVRVCVVELRGAGTVCHMGGHSRLPMLQVMVVYVRYGQVMVFSSFQVVCNRHVMCHRRIRSSWVARRDDASLKPRDFVAPGR